ncbi:replication initiation protein [Ligilactobacillus animalis]|uniref:replication initiation protein n=1 Tax=Ligilactobacillus animalis TaxID=1605 RepID=UPI002942469C|nr:replication initiation protein [Ligilactobacillus animalis]
MNQKNETFQFPDNDLHNQIIAMDNELAKQATNFTVEEQRLFYITLASIKPNQKSSIIEIDKKAVLDMLGFQSQNQYSRLRQMFTKMIKKSLILSGDDEIWNDGFLFYKCRSTKKKIYIYVDDEYIPLLIKLQPGFTRLLSDDAISFKSKYSMILYQQIMRLNNKGDFGVGFTTKELKTLFGLSKDDYVKKDGHFNRTTFENRTIDVAVKDINEKSKCIQNLRYEKRKKNGRVQGYVFFFDYTDPNEFRTTYNSDEKSSSKKIKDSKKFEEDREYLIKMMDTIGRDL